MTQEEKDLLLKDLCARLPYGAICHTEEGDGYLCSINQTIFGTEYGLNINPLKRDYFSDSETDEQAVKPYLRPLSSMTAEEEYEYHQCKNIDYLEICEMEHTEMLKTTALCFSHAIDWLNAHHFDYRGLIENGLALEALKGMYKTE